eukprot:NODE_1281_length_1492_cov_101.135828_g1065_i0.p1 GENE.NODE_1281_length_1492_cov_101.135828_g1065_i0~~NODE_1281_length_1492_cov_101.135828_g1065_i0.p1  ORF type:complete len:443 (+),score=141.14 NODE_1281_length_1492_cov_101.135828_g1065_i0:52-1380(+)
MSDDEKQDKPLIMFSTSKREALNPAQGFRLLHRKLRNNYRVDLNKEGVNLEALSRANLHIFAGPREKFDEQECQAIHQYLRQGGSVLFLLSEGGEIRLGTNLNQLFDRWGIEVRPDAVVRTVFYKYYHPKEVCITNGVLNRGINRAAGKQPPGIQATDDVKKGFSIGNNVTSVAQAVQDSCLVYVYPYGASLNVNPPAVPILSSGFIAYPLQRPVAAVYEDYKGKGRAMVIGSLHMFHDDWIQKEENSKLQEVLFEYLLHSPKVELDAIESEHHDTAAHQHIPDVSALAERLRVCIEEKDRLPQDFTQMYADDMFRFDTSVIPEAVQLYDQLSVKHEPLTLIHPEFEVPLPALQPAVFGPTHREPPAPALDLFDLDAQFASVAIQLAQLTNKCSADDLDYFIRECGEVLGVTKQLPQSNRGDAKAILEQVFKEIIQFKKLNH